MPHVRRPPPPTAPSRQARPPPRRRRCGPCRPPLPHRGATSLDPPRLDPWMSGPSSSPHRRPTGRPSSDSCRPQRSCYRRLLPLPRARRRAMGETEGGKERGEREGWGTAMGETERDWERDRER
ncbi:hypothetical protein PVAP13_8NG329356 [Panicum virgatum]|uniref:Uncharacterized protein n=1 Tax=Panicum virgatum TaxID=38727 RepID=A0A8T0P9U2_PANVG|nr:hypothetical protein PVAP13_8NG329356 [Panicum virgatum]